jgi:circadian clock protein KaiC
MTIKSVAGERARVSSDSLQYMTDCVILMEDMVTATTRSRSLRIAKYRGSGFSGNPAPVVINRSGVDVVILRNLRASYPTFTDRVSTGVPRLDALLGGGYGHGHTVLLSGAPGTAKTSLCEHFVAAACNKGKKTLYVSFDESASQIVANASAIGLNLKSYIEAGHLIIESLTSFGRSPEEDFVAVRGLLEMHSPDCLVIDPLSALTRTDYPFAILILQCLLDSAKSRGVTVLCTSVVVDESEYLMTLGVSIATMADTWIHVTYIANEGERNRALTIIKSRGIGHSDQVRQLVLTDSGIDLSDVYVAEVRS